MQQRRKADTETAEGGDEDEAVINEKTIDVTTFNCENRKEKRDCHDTRHDIPN
jgi:hypothetical protein